LVGFLFLLVYTSLQAQISYPFLETENNRDIQAYWYNIPEANVSMEIGNQMDFRSSLHLYGAAPAEKFRVEASVYLRNGKKVLEKVFELDRAAKEDNIEFRQNFFKIIVPAEFLNENPDRIIVTVESPKGKRTKEIKCRYHKLSGKITDFDGKPMKAYVVACPDSFAGDQLGKWSDEQGHYEIGLPERTYNAIVANTEHYGLSLLEAWGWHIIMDSDQTLDFKIGNGEVYNLNVWTNNGGGWNYFISFRPMALDLSKKPKKYSVNLSAQEIPIHDIAPDFLPKDLKVRINGQEAEIISLQKFYETQAPDHGMPDYLIQVKRSEAATFGKQTVQVEYDKEVEVDGKKVRCTSIGCCQFYLNYYGLSYYF
jgi:hypothetical protein